jgi:outer membrane protein OmpA-like peptidoglycan-associated protein
MQAEMNGELINTKATVQLQIKQDGKDLVVKSIYHAFNEQGAEFQTVTTMKGTYKKGEVQLKTKDVDLANTFAVPRRGGGITTPVAVVYNYHLYGTIRQKEPFLVFSAFQKPMNTAAISGRYPKQRLGVAMDYGHNPIMTPREITFKRFIGAMPQPATRLEATPTPLNPYEQEEIEEEFKNILFVQQSTQFSTAKEYQKVDELGKVLQQHPNWKVILHGHTQQDGGRDQNQVLSERRAQLVRDLLIQKYNIAEKRISTKGYGSTTPLTGHGSKKYLNRRVEIEIIR